MRRRDRDTIFRRGTSGAWGVAMFILLALAALAGLVAFASFVWLLVVAFKTHVGWGLALLFLPLAPIVFAVKHWHAAKKPFLLNLGGSVACFALFFAAGGMAVKTAADMAAASAAMGDGSLSAEAAVSDAVADEGAANDSGSGSEPVESEPAPVESDANAGLEPSSPSMAPIEASMAAPAPRPKRIHGEISVDDIDERHVGNALRVVSRSGMNTLAVLTGVSRNELTFEREVGGGTFEFVLQRDEIESITSIE